MKNSLKFAAAFVLTGFSFAATAQGTKPVVAKEGKMETKAEEKMETKKEEKMEMTKGNKMHNSGAKMHHGKMASKAKM